MRIAVCIKQVPDTEGRLKIAADGRWIDPESTELVINDSDEYALEEALRIAEATDDEVAVVTLGPESAKEALRKGLALGAQRAIHLSDPAFLGGDAISTARALAAVVEREGFDLVLTGSQSKDEGYGATGSILAGHLGWPHAWLVMGVEIEDGQKSAKVTREMESGMNEIFRLQLPAVIEVQAGINQPRYASLKGIMAAKRKPLDALSPSDLGLDPAEIGAAGARLEVLEVAFPAEGEGAQILEGDPKDAVAALVEKLEKEARVL